MIPGKWIFCGGMSRSGSTLQYCLASELIERTGHGRRTGWTIDHDRALAGTPEQGWSTFKSHVLTSHIRRHLENGDAVALYCYRDLRDVISSHQQKNSFVLPKQETRDFVREQLEQFENWTSLERVHVSRYEEFAFDLEQEVRRQAEFLSIPCDQQLARDIARHLQYDTQQQRIRLLENRLELGGAGVNLHDKHTLLHLNHFQSGRVGRHREDLDPWQIKVIEKSARPWHRRRGYLW